jgi:hypothetical protein
VIIGGEPEFARDRRGFDRFNRLTLRLRRSDAVTIDVGDCLLSADYLQRAA